MNDVAFINNEKLSRIDFLKYVVHIFNYKFHLPLDVSKFIACQCALESNFGCSDLARNSYNLFGMKNPKSRFTCSIACEFDNFAVYESFLQSAFDYYSLLMYNKLSQKDVKSIDSFVSFINKIKYCPDKDYCDCILRILSNYESSFEKFKSEVGSQSF